MYRTPITTSAALGELCGGSIVLKAENLQRTGSFKIRGALNKLSSLGAAARNGVTAGSAGNHAQARRLGHVRPRRPRRPLTRMGSGQLPTALVDERPDRERDFHIRTAPALTARCTDCSTHCSFVNMAP